MLNVNGVTIGDDAVAREMQHHPAETREEVARRAATALIVRELLLQRVRDLEIAGADEDERIANLVDLEARVPEPTLEECERYYRRNTLRFTTSPLYEAAHIFFPARADDADARAEAKTRADAVFNLVLADPRRFGELAKAHSACSSREHGGSLGQITKGDTNPEFERTLATMDVGAISLVASRHGFHVLRLDRRVARRQLPLEQCRPWIEAHLRKMSKRRAVAQYLQLLSANASIEGIDLAVSDGPLMQ